MRRNVLTAIALFIPVICIHSVRSEYVEDTGTTDANGYGLNEAFQVTDWGISGSIYVSYCFESESSTGFYNYAFDEIKMAPDKDFAHLNACQNTSTGCCFIALKNNIYSKVQILEKGTRCRFRYGTATTPGDRMLVKSSYDRSIRYKVNNLYNYQNYCGGAPGCVVVDTLYWEPPLPNNNHLRGYILYVFESFTKIDTTKPANTVQWDSIAFYPSSTRKAYCEKFPKSGYFNMVAVYDEGKSDFLDNWTYVREGRISNRNNGPTARLTGNTFSIRNTETELVFEFSGLVDKAEMPQIDLYNLAGRLIASCSIDKTGTFGSISKKLLPLETCVAHFTTTSGKVYTKPVFCIR